MAKLNASKIGGKTASGGFSDAALHEKIMAGVDDTPLRVMSALKMVASGTLTQEEAESVFSVKLSDDQGAI
jgi:hypothetical protein